MIKINKNNKSNKNNKYKYKNAWIAIKITKQNYDPFYPPYKASYIYFNNDLTDTTSKTSHRINRFLHKLSQIGDVALRDGQKW